MVHLEGGSIPVRFLRFVSKEKRKTAKKHTNLAKKRK